MIKIHKNYTKVKTKKHDPLYRPYYSFTLLMHQKTTGKKIKHQKQTAKN
jgi:hypothetical protein